MEENIKFSSEVCYDLATYKDFSRINTYTIPRVTFCGLLYVACMTYLLCTMAYSFSAKSVLILSLVTIGICVYQWYRNRDGGIEYKRMLRNHGQIPHYLITFGESGIVTKNMDSGNEIPHRYTDMRYMMESKKLLILVDDLKTAHMVDKSTLTGGSREELVSFLRQSCPKLKKRIRKGGIGRILWYLMRILPIVMLAASLLSLLHIPEKLRGQFTNDTPAKQMVEELADLDIHISDQALDTILLWESDCVSLFPKYPGASKVYDLLCVEGQGRYEKNVFYQEGPVEAYDWTWTPSTSGVYWFDLEVINISAIYSDFLQGVSAMDDSLTFTNVEEDYSNADILNSWGEIGFSFDYLGEHYTFSAQYNGDWFDTDMLYHLGRILAADEDPKDLWMTLDGQGVLLYYGTEESKDLLVRKTGIDFFDCVTMRMGH